MPDSAERKNGEIDWADIWSGGKKERERRYLESLKNDPKHKVTLDESEAPPVEPDPRYTRFVRGIR